MQTPDRKIRIRPIQFMFILVITLSIAIPPTAVAENVVKVEGKFKELQVQLAQAKKQLQELQALNDIVLDRYERILQLVKEDKKKYRSKKLSAKEVSLNIKETHKMIKDSFKDIKGPYERFKKESLESRKAAEALMKELKKK